MVNMKASMSEEALATKVSQTFDVEATGRAIKTSLLTWSEGNPVSVRDFAEAIELLGTTKCGIIELVVISEQQFAHCPNCVPPFPLILWCVTKRIYI